MSNLDGALASFWQLARHWQHTAECQVQQPDLLHFHHPFAPPCKRKSSSQLRWQKRRRHVANTYIEEAKSTQNLCAEDIAPSNEADKPKESFLEYENPQY